MEAASGLHVIAARFGIGARLEAAYVCPNCRRINVASEWADSLNSDSHISNQTAADERQWYDATWIPRHQEAREFPDVPTPIAQAATEATLCLSVGAYRAVGALARAVIEATAKDKGADGKTLEKRIDALHADDHVRKHTKEQAHEIRHFGNDMAHGDFADPVTREEAEEVVELMSEVLDEVYQSPARLQRRKEARLGEKVEGDPGMEGPVDGGQVPQP